MIKPSGDLKATSSILKTVIIDNLDVLRPFDAVSVYGDGNPIAATAGLALFGIIISIVDKNDLPLSPERASLAVVGSGSINTSVVPAAVTVASNNETVDLIAAKIDISMQSQYSADCNANPGTTATSDKPGVFVDLSDQRTIGESTASRTITNGGQFYGFGTDPLDSGNMFVSIHESEIFTLGKVLG